MYIIPTHFDNILKASRIWYLFCAHCQIQNVAVSGLFIVGATLSGTLLLYFLEKLPLHVKP